MEEMNLKNFVSSTLLQIIEGADDARRAAKNFDDPRSGSHINPREAHAHHANPTNVEFDVAVTVTSGTEGKADAGIKVVGFHVGGGGAKTFQNQAVSRIRFSVPVTLPSEPVNQYDPPPRPARALMYDDDN